MMSEMTALKNVAEEIIGTMTSIASVASGYSPTINPDKDVLVPNNDVEISNLSRLQEWYPLQMESCEVWASEPVIARVRVNKKGEEKTYYFCRAINSPGGNVVSYGAALGRLASLPLGKHEIELPKGKVVFDIMEKEIIKPVKKTTGWDSSPSIVFFKEIGTKTIQSLRALLSLDTETKQVTTKAEVSRGTSTSQTITARPTHIITSWDARKDISPTIKESAIDLSDSLLEEYEDENVSSGIRRDVIAKMTLRDQPILDQYQDEIFRLPLDKRLMILGAPGTGKTTTLIHRLGQKLHADLLTSDEQQLVKEIELKFKNTHSTNWLMFTPTELLKHYLKESFSRANVPAPDTNVQVWDNFRRVLARDKRFKVLRDTRKGSGFVLNDEIQNIRDETFAKTIEWYEDFYAWQRHKYSIEIRTQFEQMINDMDYSMILDSNNLAKTIVTEKWTRIVGEENQTFATCVSWLKTRSIHLANLREKLDNMTTPYDKSPLKDAIKINLLLAEINRIAKTFNKAVHDKVIDLTDGEKTRINNKAVDDKSTNISDEGKNDKEKPKIILQIISIPSIFDSPIKYYLNGIPKRYKSFRLQRQKESKWYKSEMTDTNDIHPIEVDIVLLAILRTVRNWTKSKWNDIVHNTNDWQFLGLNAYFDIFRNQILVDEATDFSPIQLACMASLSHPKTNSFFSCGDFNQRITSWGTRSHHELKRIFPDFDFREITIAYRQSQQLNEFSKAIIQATDGIQAKVILPDRVDNQGVAPALLEHAKDQTVVSWLAERIYEIERLMDQQLPSLAIFVNSESEVSPFAKALNSVLREYNVRVIACHDGQTLGSDGDVRVFDIRHIKGLEFEAAFFVNIDRLADQFPDLFDKYLYVGATRAAIYLGITCEETLPYPLDQLRGHFCKDWKNETKP